ncbi:hypothetical protein C4J81_19315 (plasmid) [Deltaproteobacteria bacterium Smac51]|nr:hypothetical protein C4J81_19315 [Deltaproteobacteria bacterium Smac51]
MSDNSENFDFKAYPDKLNLGCGLDHRDGYLNVDLQSWHNPDLTADILNLDMLPSGHYVEIIAQDVLEHLQRDQTEIALREWNRLLALNGILLLRVPDLLGVARLFQRQEYKSIENQKILIQCLYGTQAYTGDFHLTSFTPDLMNYYLNMAGFEICEMCCKDEWLLDIRARKVSEDSSVGVISPGSRIKRGDCLNIGRSGQFAQQILTEGWAGLESWGVWSCGNFAAISIPVSEAISQIEIKGHAMVAPNHPEQRLMLNINGLDLPQMVLAQYELEQITVQLPQSVQEELVNGGLLRLKLNLPDAVSPSSVISGADDDRLLALGLSIIKFL